MIGYRAISALALLIELVDDDDDDVDADDDDDYCDDETMSCSNFGTSCV